LRSASTTLSGGCCSPSDRPDQAIRWHAARNCSGKPLDPGALGKKHREEIEETFTLAGEIRVRKIVTMSGLPKGRPAT
jgi:hypothetical protein